MSIQEIQSSFIAEAAAAPSLFADLAKVELYIAESYRSRAFIELLQNADDAQSRRFLIQQIDDKLIVANDGRAFTDKDVIALCRSGASNKQRGTGTIGYRGIGFKSVAGIAHDITIISGECVFQFSKTLTQRTLKFNSDVPLIRIPHPIGVIEPALKALAEPLWATGYNTIFVLSGLDERMVAEEAASFNESAMLFLNHVSEVEINLPKTTRRLALTAIQTQDGLSIERIENMDGGVPSSWLVTGVSEGDEKIAFSLDGEVIVPASPEQSVIHAFMPTTEFAGALLKLNGDFSTDPSRKSVDLDATSKASFERCIEALCKLLQTAISSNRLPGIFSPFILTTPVEGRFRKILRESLVNCLDKSPWSIKGIDTKPLDTRLRPEWLGYADYETLCHNAAYISQETISTHPQVSEFLRWAGARTLSLDEALVLMNNAQLTPIGCAQIFCRAARQYRYDLTAERLAILAASPLLPTTDGFVAPADFSGNALRFEFIDYLKQQPEADDIRYLSRKLKLPDELLGTPPSQVSNTQILGFGGSNPVVSKTVKVSESSLFKSPPAIKAWRSAEQNTLAWLSSLNGVISATDVSQANVGYDIEVIKRDGTRACIEVKSVPRFGDAFRLTNNEHATAYQLGESYMLALVVNSSDQFHIRFIHDPVRTLKLEKRCEQWSWYSDNYLDFLREVMEKKSDSNS